MRIGRRSHMHRFWRNVAAVSERERERSHRFLQTTFQQILGSNDLIFEFPAIPRAAIKVGMSVAAKLNSPRAAPVANLIPSQREEISGPFDQIVLEFLVILDRLRCH